MRNKPIVIIGGMGPEASAYLYDKLIEQSITLYKAVNNDDFPEIVLHSIPVPDFISNNNRRKEALRILIEKVKLLNALDPLCIAIACNTAHVLIYDLQKVSKAPFISMIDEVVKVIKKDKIKTVGLLGTPSTLRSSIYQNAFKKEGIRTLVPEENDFVDIEIAVRKVISETITEKDCKALENIADILVEKGAQCIILGCTELPLIFPLRYRIPVYNSVKILSLSLLQKYYKQ